MGDQPRTLRRRGGGEASIRGTYAQHRVARQLHRSPFGIRTVTLFCFVLFLRGVFSLVASPPSHCGSRGPNMARSPPEIVILLSVPMAPSTVVFPDMPLSPLPEIVGAIAAIELR